ncbi:MAG: PqqD family protein [Thermoprotei archaeon]|nr:PqqD family protein [Thermoprotei archaeon]
MSSRRKKPSKIVIPRPILLKSKPVRNPYVKWEKYPSGEIAILVKHKEGLASKFLSLFVRVPEHRKIALDKVGSFVWELCDGNHTVSEIIDKLVDKYKLKRREAEVALMAYLQQLIKRRLIGLIPPKQPESSPT